MAEKTTRQQILDYLGVKEIATTAELSRVLHVTPADVRYHLANLTQEGLVRLSALAKGRGRPMQLFGLAKTGLENNLPQLTSALLNLLQSSLGPEEYGGLLNKLAQTLASQEKPRPDSANLRLRLIDCVAYLNQHHYHARWEAHKTGPRVILHHCPYLDIMNHHPELCAFDRSFLENWLGDAVEQVAKLAALPQGTTYCCFQVRR